MRSLLFLLVVVAAAEVSLSFTFPHVFNKTTQPERRTSLPSFLHTKFHLKYAAVEDDDDDGKDIEFSWRRGFQASVVAAAALATAKPAFAVKPRNEQLCGTGLFTNYLEYRCTELGDISDEGQKTSFSAKEEGVADSLLSKSNLALDKDIGSSDKSKLDAVGKDRTKDAAKEGDKKDIP